MYGTVTLATAGTILALIAALNWMMDPAHLFRQRQSAQEFAKRLVRSPHGLVTDPAIDDREYKAEFAKYAAEFDCVVIGSSHVMQIGSQRRNRSFNECRRLMNLGVAGAGLEDHVTLAWLTISHGKPRRVVFGVDPWTFSFNADERWVVRYKNLYQRAKAEIDGDRVGVLTLDGRWKELLNAQYTLQSARSLLRDSRPVIEEVSPNDVADDVAGGPVLAILPDGSKVYQAAWVAKKFAAGVPLGGIDYKSTLASLNEEAAVTAYREMVRWVKSKGVQPVLLMTPYHPNVWALETSPNVSAMLATERRVMAIGQELDVPVVGSFRPETAGCLAEEFYDFMHPTATCMAKLTNLNGRR